MRVADLRAAFGRTVGRARDFVLRILDTVPPVRRMLDDLVRVEVVDRSMVIGAQALLALIPMLIILGAFLPEHVINVGIDRFESVLGMGASSRTVEKNVNVSSLSGSVPDAEQIRTTTGYVGLAITLFSATSFARAIQRMYERVWHLPHRGGVVGRRRCLSWLLGWLVATQVLTLLTWVQGRVDEPLTDPVWFALRAAASTLIWWWSVRVLLFSRVPYPALFVPAMITGVALTIYTGGSSLVMPRYAAASASQFGTLGLVLAVATWLVGYAGVMVVAATIGRVIAEDELVRSFARRVPLVRHWVPGSGPTAPPPAARPQRSPGA